jgi:predicted acylesterase/phospholipase RssA
MSPAELLARRDENDRQYRQDSRELMDRLLEQARAKYDQQVASGGPDHATIDILVISGGGDWGAFGAGVLKGWGSVPTGPMARPTFDVVTGVSTGALIAPFAFVGTDDAIDAVDNLYRHPKKDWVKNRWPFFFLPTNLSFATVPGLERELRANATPEMIGRIADESARGRVLVMNTTNVDDGTRRVWDVGAEAQRAVKTADYSRIYQVMLASSGIPAVFPSRIIDGEMYVDGGVTANIIYGGRNTEEATVAARWAKKYPDAPMPTIRYWIIFNNQIRPLPQVTEAAWPAIISRSLETGTRSATVTSMLHLHALAEIAMLKYGMTIEIRVMSIPGDWSPPKPGVFVKETMNNLADLGEKMGADPSRWQTEPPL